MWFAFWTARDYFGEPKDFHLRVSAAELLMYLFAGWLIALLKWKAGADKKNARRRSLEGDEEIGG